MATRITVHGARLEVAPTAGATFTLAELQAVVGGYIEAVYLRDGRVLFCNEDGKRFALTPNLQATILAHEHGAIGRDDFIVGDVIVGTRAEFGGGDEAES